MRWIAIAAVVVVAALAWAFGRGNPPQRSRVPVGGEPSETQRTPEAGPPAPVPPPEPRPSEEAALPACYFGDVTIEGIVHDEQGTRMADMRIECVPAGIVPAGTEALARFTATSGAGGSFRFEALPRAGRYAFHASGPGAYGEAVKTLDEVSGVAMEIEVSSTVSYERYDFFDEEGRPIDVRGRFAFGVGDLIWASGLGVDASREARFAAIGVPLGDLPSNAAVAVFRRASPPRTRGPDGEAVVPLTINIMGYESQRVEPVRFRPSEWPRSTRVTLHADGPPWIPYEIHLPAAPQPMPVDIAPEIEALWGRMTLRVRIGEGLTEVQVSRAQPRFWAPDGMAFRIGLWPSDIALSYHARKAGTREELTLDMPDLALPVLRFDPSTAPWARVNDREQVHFQIERGRSRLIGREWRPGLVLFDPVPAGAATLRCVWPEGGGFTSQTRALALEAGVCEIRWD